MQTKSCRYDKILQSLTKFGFSGKNSNASNYLMAHVTAILAVLGEDPQSLKEESGATRHSESAGFGESSHESIFALPGSCTGSPVRPTG